MIDKKELQKARQATLWTVAQSRGYEVVTDVPGERVLRLNYPYDIVKVSFGNLTPTGNTTTQGVSLKIFDRDIACKTEGFNFYHISKPSDQEMLNQKFFEGLVWPNFKNFINGFEDKNNEIFKLVVNIALSFYYNDRSRLPSREEINNILEWLESYNTMLELEKL